MNLLGGYLIKRDVAMVIDEGCVNVSLVFICACCVFSFGVIKVEFGNI